MSTLVRKQWTIEGQLGDRAIVEVGRGSVYVNAGGSEQGDNHTGMFSAAGARELAVRLIEAADACDAVG
jgi:hypothetical protein